MNLTTPILVLLVTGALYFFIGFRLRAKVYADPSDAFAWRAFRSWWMGMSFNSLLNALGLLLFSLNVLALPLFMGINFVSSVAAATALWGLLTYLVYVYTGRNRSWLLAGFYIAFIALLFLLLFLFQPTGVIIGDWQVAMEYSNPPVGAPAFAFALSFILLIGLPPVIASIGMFLLFLRIQERSAKYRAGLVSLGIFMLFGLAIIVPLLLYPFGFRTNQIAWWPLGVRLTGILALALIYFAYFPPAFVQKWLKVKTVLA